MSVSDPARRPEQAVDRPWAAAPDGAARSLDSPEDGLSTEEAQRRLEEHGPNRLREIGHRSLWRILWEQVRSLIMLLLVVAMGVSFAFGETVEALAIAAVIVLNTAIGFVTEWRAVRAMEALQKLGGVDATVRRDGREERIDAEEIVPGDRVILQEGDLVPADLRILTADRLQLDESALTGESVPVGKNPDPVDEEAPLAERTSMAYKGTTVTRGGGETVAVATGMATELGEISELVESAQSGQVPLEERLEKLGRKLVWLTLAVAGAVIGAGVVAGREVYLMVETGIALAVAAVPEGLPIVATVALASGMRRMVRRNALIRRLSSVETLGSTTLICTDKTGTLTENRMEARHLELAEGGLEVDDDTELSPAAREAVRVGVLCSNASLEGEDGPSGDPMEVALLELGRRCELERGALLEELPEEREEPFDRDTKMMATFHRDGDGLMVAVKGAPEAVLEASSSVLDGEEERDLGDDERRSWLERSEALAGEGLRLLGLARRRADDAGDEPYEDLTFLGFVGLLDPPREEVRGAIERCREAGIRVLMVTGDHPATARAIAEAVRLVPEDEEPEAISGKDFPDLESASEEERQAVLRADVFARVSPKQKLELIDLHQDAGEIVAMTGDGVNDAPALRSADIGIAMGRRGTEVARQASDMVLQDDSFPTIVAAVQQGRVIFENIRRFAVYLLSGNVGEILAVGAAAVSGSPLPLLPLQILYLNMLNDVFPALALGVGPGSGNLMDRPPRDPAEPVITRWHWGLIGGYGLVIAAVVLGVFAIALGPLGFDTTRAVTVSFLTLSTARLLHAFNMRSATGGVLRNEITRNRWLWGAIVLDIGLLLLAVYLTPLARILELTPPGLEGWLLVAAGAVAPLFTGQIFVAIGKRGV